MIRAFSLLLRRKARSAWNDVAFSTPWILARNGAFSAAGLGLLYGLYCGFHRLLAYLVTVPLIGTLILWKLTAMLLLSTFMMVVVSGMLTSLSTLYYSFDLKFLLNAPLPLRAVFLEKSLESAFYASWMIALILVPFMIALEQVSGYGRSFVGIFLVLSPPFLGLAAAFGIAFALGLLYAFPTSRTRDAVWILSSLSLTLVYSLIRLAQPERLIRPDALRAVAEYLSFLQAPTARYLPSWWLTKALEAYSGGRVLACAEAAALLYGTFAAAYAVLVWAAGSMYFRGYSGAQEGGLRRRPWPLAPIKDPSPLLWKERLTFFRDVKHWSQITMVLGLVFVYLFSIRRLPLDSADLRSLISFLNIGAAGFVVAALGLRFTFPAISLEGKAWWVLRASPLDLGKVMRHKLLFSLGPMLLIALALGATTDWLLDADRFVSAVSVGALLVMAASLCAMGVGFGAAFPLFDVENIHQVESSLGGFVYMACALFYVGANVMILSWPVRMHFEERFGRSGAWRGDVALVCLALWTLLNLAAAALPWAYGRRALEACEL